MGFWWLLISGPERGRFGESEVHPAACGANLCSPGIRPAGPGEATGVARLF